MRPKWGEGTWTWPWLMARVVFGIVLAAALIGVGRLIEVLT